MSQIYSQHVIEESPTLWAIFRDVGDELSGMGYESEIQIVEVAEQATGGYGIELYRADGTPETGYAYGHEVRDLVDRETVDQVEYMQSLDEYRPKNVGIFEEHCQETVVRTVHIESAELCVEIIEPGNGRRIARIDWTQEKRPWFAQQNGQRVAEK